jgi:ferredoxin-NADP reductase
VLVCAGDRESAPLGAEVDDLARDRAAALSWVGPATPLTAERLLALVPDLTERDVFVVGRSDWVGEVRAALRAAGVADRQVSSEGFG